MNQGKKMRTKRVNPVKNKASNRDPGSPESGQRLNNSFSDEIIACNLIDTSTLFQRQINKKQRHRDREIIKAQRHIHGQK